MKYYRIAFYSLDGCEFCHRKFYMEEGKRVEAQLETCGDCQKHFCSNCNIETKKGFYCLNCANKLMVSCPVCHEPNFIENEEYFKCENPECTQYDNWLKLEEIDEIFKYKTHPRLAKSPLIDYTINVTLHTPPKFLSELLSCNICTKRKQFSSGTLLINHIKQKHPKRYRKWKRHTNINEIMQVTTLEPQIKEQMVLKLKFIYDHFLPAYKEIVDKAVNITQAQLTDKHVSCIGYCRNCEKFSFDLLECQNCNILKCESCRYDCIDEDVHW